MKKYPLLYCLRKSQNDQVTTMISYAKYKSVHGLFKVLHFPGRFHLLPEPTQSFYWHGKETSRKFWTFPETSMTIHFLFQDDKSSF